MIAFSSLFLGLIVGLLPVTVLVENPVASVRFEVDGRVVGRVARAPWTLPIDFGAEPLPHELVARALDKEGKEMGIARQFVNLPRPPAEVEVLLERDAKGRPVAARFSGQSLIASRPARVTVTLDGRSLELEESNRVALPEYDADARHLLSVELEFSSAVRSRTDVAFGGAGSNVASSELTAVAVRSSAPGRVLEAGDLEGALVREGHPLTVVAVEQGPALACIVRGPSVAPALKALGAGGRTIWIPQGRGRNLPQFDRDASRARAALEKDDLLRFVWPMPRFPAESPGAQLFDRSRDFHGADGGLPWLLTRVEHPEQHPPEVRLADAAAVAGLEAAASGGRRAVVLVLGEEKSDPSRHSPASVRRYLEAIRVPFFVWSLKSLATQPLAKAWGAVEDVSSASRIERAVEKLKAELASQRIVWVQGRYLPQEIALSGRVGDLELVR